MKAKPRMLAPSDLFGPLFSEPRKPPRVMMHVVDAGPGDCSSDDLGGIAVFECGECGYKTDWTKFRTTSEAKRGMPCPRCNQRVRK